MNLTKLLRPLQKNTKAAAGIIIAVACLHPVVAAIET